MTDDERDESIDRLLRRGLSRDSHAPSASSCVDPETLAAWMDGSLPQETLRTAERHVAGCARCQAMLAAMARTAPATPQRPWWRLTRQWLVPIAAAATALVLWVAVDRDRGAPMASVPAETAAPAPAAAPLPSPSASREEMLPRRLAPPSRSADSVGAGGGNATAPHATTRTPSAQAKAADGRVEDRLQPLTKTPTAPRRLETTDRPAVMATRPSPPAASPVPSLAEPSPPTQARERVAGVPETVGVSETAAQLAGRAGGGQATGASTDIVSPEPSFRWRLLAPSTILRSTDGGVTWTVQSGRTPGLALLTSAENALPIVLTAGSSPARDICWIVGRGGVVLLSSNGIAWQRRPFAEAANLVAVRAADAKTAVVTTEDGRQFSTSDGGATWLKIP